MLTDASPEQRAAAIVSVIARSDSVRAEGEGDAARLYRVYPLPAKDEKKHRCAATDGDAPLPLLLRGSQPFLPNHHKSSIT